MTPERSYAEALADVALAEQRAEQVRRELGDFLQMMAESADLRNFLSSPAVPASSKRSVIAKLVEQMGASQALRNFLYLVVDHRRVGLLGAIAEAFGEELNLRLGILDAEIAAARDLPDAEKQALVAALERRTGKRVVASYRVEPELIGGVRVRIGSTVLDGSVRSSLDRLRARMAAGQR
ncbi:MAG TPA: ATP synthase F1 subunit delta [Patescibacteria group bacterium]|nr:ATP synthase F1 subunit delta [Patescibacteria group bacterium]